MKLYKILMLVLFAYALISCGGAEERKAVYLEKARVSFEAGDLDKTRIELKNVLQIDPKDSDAYFFLGKVYEQQQDFRKAFSHYLKAEELDPDNLENLSRLGRIYLFLANEPEKAQEKIDYILSKEPDNSHGLLLKASSLVKNGDVTQAITISKDVIAKNSGHIEGAKFLATLYVSENKNVDAINVLDNTLKLNQNNEQLNRLLAVILMKNKNFDRAEGIYKKFLENNPDNVTSYNNLVAFYIQADRKGEAEKMLRTSIENDTSDVDRQISLVKYIKQTQGDEQAIAELKKLTSQNSGLGKLRTALAELLYLKGEEQASIDVYNQAISDFPDESTSVESRISLATIYFAKKNHTKATETINAAIKTSPNDPKVNFIKAKLAIHDKNFEQAILSLRIVTKETPENIDAFLLLTEIYKTEQNVEQVRSTLNNAYESNRTNADGLLKLAQYHMSRDIHQAEKIIDDYNNVKETDYKGLSIKAAILNKNKESTKAFKIAEVLIKSFPGKPNGYLQTIPYYGQKNNTKEAIATLEKGYMNTKDNRKILVLLSSLQVSEKQFDIVLNRINAELKTHPEDVELKLLLTKVYIAKKDNRQAELILKEVINEKGSVEEPYLLLSQIYLTKKNTESAKDILMKGKNNVTNSKKIPLKLAAMYEFENEYEKAIDEYRLLNKKFPNNLLIANNLASMLSDHSESKEDLKFAKSLADTLAESGQPVFLDTIGWVYYKLSDAGNAIKYLTQAAEKAPKVQVFNYHLGMAHKMAGDKVQAKIYLEKSLANGKPFKQQALVEIALKEL